MADVESVENRLGASSQGAQGAGSRGRRRGRGARARLPRPLGRHAAVPGRLERRRPRAPRAGIPAHRRSRRSSCATRAKHPTCRRRSGRASRSRSTSRPRSRRCDAGGASRHARDVRRSASPRSTRSRTPRITLLGRRTFLTTGDKESRAWTFRAGAKAPECAGVIHSDLQRGFIRAEVIRWDELLEIGSWSKARDARQVARRRQGLRGPATATFSRSASTCRTTAGTRSIDKARRMHEVNEGAVIVEAPAARLGSLAVRRLAVDRRRRVPARAAGGAVAVRRHAHELRRGSSSVGSTRCRTGSSTSSSIGTRILVVVFLGGGLVVTMLHGRIRYLLLVLLAAAVAVGARVPPRPVRARSGAQVVDVTTRCRSGRSSGVPSGSGLAAIVAIVTVAAPWTSRRWRRLGWMLVSGLAFDRFVTRRDLVRHRSRRPRRLGHRGRGRRRASVVRRAVRQALPSPRVSRASACRSHDSRWRASTRVARRRTSRSRPIAGSCS